jgi:hypothetical protein
MRKIALSEFHEIVPKLVAIHTQDMNGHGITLHGVEVDEESRTVRIRVGRSPVRNTITYRIGDELSMSIDD